MKQAGTAFPPANIMNNNHFDKFDKVIIILSVCVLVFALFFPQKREIIFIKTKINFLQWWENDIGVQSFESIIKDFENEHPEITVSVVTKSYREVYDTIKKSDIISGDVVAIDPLWFDDQTTKTIFEKLQFEDKGEEKYGAEARSVPLVSFINPLFYNIDALKETGFDRPPKTREEFLDVSLSIMRTNKSIKPFIIGENIYTDIFPWIWSSGVDIKSIKENSSFDWTQKQIVETLDFIKKLHYSRLLANDSFAGNAKDKLVNFAKGKIAMITAGAADIIKMPPELNFSVTTIPVPRGAFAKPVFNVSAWHAGVPLNSKHKKEAFVFLSYLNDNKQKLSETSGALPTYRESSGAEKIKNHQDVYSKMNDLQKASDIVFDNEIFVSCESLEAIIKEEITKMFIGNITAKECAAGIQERYLQCISNN
ncbi:hypothetical protein FACS1894190_08890 [Spirochaetia bacterium]|nr:hypothetical protein FACS1894190_08890 [Spirochaetia bacterium]